MAENQRVLDANYIKALLGGKRKLGVGRRPENTRITLDVDIKLDPLKFSPPGYMQSGDKGDIWAQWVKQGRTGATELIERWGVEHQSNST